MKWQTFQAFNLSQDQTSDPDFWNKASSAYEHFKKFRSEVIEAGLFIEGALNNVLLDFLSGPSTERRKLLKATILDGEFCTFFQKWRLLRQLLDLYSAHLTLDVEEMKGLRKELHDAIALRNRFAHGVIHVDGSDLSVWIEYMEGTRQFERLDEAELNASKDAFDRIHARLWRVHEAVERVGYVLPAHEA